jgi:hypothetical protein
MMEATTGQQVRQLTPTSPADNMLIKAHPVSQPTRITPQHPMTFWDTAACPTTTDPLFAIAASEGLHTIHGGENNWLMRKHEIDTGPKNPRSKGHRWPQKNSVCSVEWFNQDVIMSGRKNGAILFNDLRTGSSTTNFQHSDSVMQLKKVDDWRIVAAGPRYVCIHLISLLSFDELHIEY